MVARNKEVYLKVVSGWLVSRVDISADIKQRSAIEW